MTMPTPVENASILRVGDVVHSVWKYRWSAILISGFLLPVFAAIVFLIPLRYDSSGKVLVRLGRGAVSIDPTANLSQTISLQETRLSQVNSVKELLSSRELAERVVKKIGPERILEPHGIVEETLDSLLSLIPQTTTKPLGDLSTDDVEAQILLEEACKQLEDSVGFSSPKEAYTISLDARTGDPFLSRDIVQAYLDEYQKYHVESHQSAGSVEFFESVVAETHQRAMQAQQALRDAKTTRNIVDITAAKTALSTAIAKLKQSILVTDSEFDATQAELVNLQAQIAELPAQLETEVLRGVPNAAGGAVRQRLYDLEVAYQDSASKLTSDHPKMISLREQLKSASQIAETEQGDLPQTRQMINPVRQQLELAFKSASAKLVGADSKKAALQAQLKELTEELVELNNNEVEINELAWNVKLAETEYLRAAAQLTTVRQISELDKQQLSEISVVQNANLMLKKAFPKRGLLLVVAAVFALAIGIGQATLRGVLAIPTEMASSGRTRSTWQERQREWLSGEHPSASAPPIQDDLSKEELVVAQG